MVGLMKRVSSSLQSWVMALSMCGSSDKTALGK